MMAQPPAPRPILLSLLAALVVAACGERAPVDQNGQGSTTPPLVRVESGPLLSDTVTPVRIGELGPNFAACNARGGVRERAGLETVAVRAAPFEQAQEIDALERSAQFFICTRTHDQRWFGIVYDEGGSAAERCGVSAPVPTRRPYEGPCAAGWVSSASVRLVSGLPHQVPTAEPSVGSPPTD